MSGVIGGSFRQCDACLLADLCPKFEPGAYCAFTVDVEIRDTDQAMAAMSTLIEIQMQRAQRAVFAEEVLGQGPQYGNVGGAGACVPHVRVDASDPGEPGDADDPRLGLG